MSFVRSASQLSRGRDATLKRALINELSECVKDIQYSSQVERDWTGVVCTGDSASSLCDALEAIFLHGLKDSLLRRARAFADPARRSQYDFWSLVLVVSHRQSVEQIAALSHVCGPTGQCRAWLRAALNDCLLSSYLATLQRNTDAVRPFYSRTAFARDPEALELARCLLEGLETCTQFRLPLNSSLLNDWPDGVLRAAGLLGESMRPAAIATALDVASTLPDTHSPRIQTAMLAPTARSTAITLDEDEALHFILSERLEITPLQINKEPVSKLTQCYQLYQSEPKQNCSPPKQFHDINISHPNKHDDVNILNSNRCDDVNISNTNRCDIVNISHQNKCDNVNIKKIESEIKKVNADNNSKILKDNSSVELHPSLPMIQNPSPKEDNSTISKSTGDTTDLRDVIREMRTLLDIEAPPGTLVECDGDRGLETLGETCFPAAEWDRLLVQLGRLSRELGLDTQNYQCAGCQDSVGGGISRARVCAFTAEYFCIDCMDPDAMVIPARVVHNWDFGRHAVSRQAARFLLEVQHRPLLDVRALNPRAYEGAGTLRVVRDMRVRLGLLRAYAETCREGDRLSSEWRRMLLPREYLCESVHVYAPADLAQVPTGQLAAVLERVAVFLREHVRGCWLCSQKGFICEVCRAPDLLYPFDSGAVYRCEVCCGVFHTSCVRATAECPRCVRRAARDRSAFAIKGSLHV